MIQLTFLKMLDCNKVIRADLEEVNIWLGIHGVVVRISEDSRYINVEWLPDRKVRVVDLIRWKSCLRGLSLIKIH